MNTPRLFSLDNFYKDNNKNNSDSISNNLTEEEIDALIEEAAEKRDNGESSEAIKMYLTILACIQKSTKLTEEKKYEKREEVSQMSYLAMSRIIQAP